MLMAWSIDKVIDLNNGLDVSHPLNFSEEVLCLGTVFCYSWVLLVASLIYHYLIKESETEENMSKFITGFYLLAFSYLIHNTFVRTHSTVPT